MAVKIGLKYIDIWGDSMEDAVVAYEKENAPKGKIVFYGPSNFTRWSAAYGHTPLREAIKGKSGAECVINRGFGSSCAEHQLYYYPRMVRPLEPKVLVYSFYGNGKAFGYSAEESWELAQRVIAYALTDFPDIHIYLCSPNHLRDEQNSAEVGNRMRFRSWVKHFAEETPNCFFIDMEEFEGNGRKDIFVDDGVHYNQKGYDLYADFMRKALKNELERF